MAPSLQDLIAAQKRKLDEVRNPVPLRASLLAPAAEPAQKKWKPDAMREGQWEDSGSKWKDSGSKWKDSGSNWKDSGSKWKDSVSQADAIGKPVEGESAQSTTKPDSPQDGLLQGFAAAVSQSESVSQDDIRQLLIKAHEEQQKILQQNQSLFSTGLGSQAADSSQKQKSSSSSSSPMNLSYMQAWGNAWESKNPAPSERNWGSRRQRSAEEEERISREIQEKVSFKTGNHKAIFCRHMKEYGTCRAGPECRFAHTTEDQIQAVRSRTRGGGYKTQPCKYHQNGYCGQGDLCTFIHEGPAGKGGDNQELMLRETEQAQLHSMYEQQQYQQAMLEYENMIQTQLQAQMMMQATVGSEEASASGAGAGSGQSTESMMAIAAAAAAQQAASSAAAQPASAMASLQSMSSTIEMMKQAAEAEKKRLEDMQQQRASTVSLSAAEKAMLEAKELEAKLGAQDAVVDQIGKILATAAPQEKARASKRSGWDSGPVQQLAKYDGPPPPTPGKPGEQKQMPTPEDISTALSNRGSVSSAFTKAVGFKHKLCIFWERGFCRSGVDCTYAHGSDDQRKGQISITQVSEPFIAAPRPNPAPVHSGPFQAL